MTHRTFLPAVCLSACFALAAVASGQDKLNGHTVKLDRAGKLISWVQPQDQAYDRVIRLAWDFLLHKVQVEPNGLKTYYTNCCIYLPSMHGTAWPHNPAGLTAMLIDSATAYFAYSGDSQPLEMARSLADYQLAHGTTPKDFDWAQVPYSSSNDGALEFRGADSTRYDKEKQGVGDGYGYTEPDKVGELGFGYLKLYELTGNVIYREAALACANALAKHVRPGDADHSPWPFRVNAETNFAREEYSSNVIGPVKLFDELLRLRLGDERAFRNARELAWNWMMKYPMQNGAWSGYFEDVYSFDKPINYNQYSPMETARYLLQHPEYDPDWRTHVPALISWVEKTLIFIQVKNEPGVQWGANAVSEQAVADLNKMGSHTSRYASINAMWFAKTGDAAAKEKAFRSFNWASYMCDEQGIVKVGPVDQSLWFSDGYGDYIRHFLSGMGSVPEWAPPGETHLLKSSSLVTTVNYANARVDYTVHDAKGSEELKLAFAPATVLVDGKPLPNSTSSAAGWSYNSQSGVLIVNHETGRSIQVKGE